MEHLLIVNISLSFFSVDSPYVGVMHYVITHQLLPYKDIPSAFAFALLRDMGVANRIAPLEETNGKKYLWLKTISNED